MTWTFVAQLAVLSLLAAFILLALAEAFRAPGNRRKGKGPVGPPGPAGPQGPQGPTGLAGWTGPACQGPCCKKPGLQ